MCYTASGEAQKTSRYTMDNILICVKQPFCGGIKNKENIAIYSKEETENLDIKNLLQVPDEKGLHVWSE